MNHRHHRYHGLSVGMYRHPIHLAISFGIILLPFLFILAAYPVPGFSASIFLTSLGFSMLRLIVAFAISVFLALFLVLFLSEGKLGAFFLPLFDVLQSFPSFAVLPLAVLLWGPSETTIIFFLTITIIWPMLFAMISSLKLIGQDWEEAAQIYGARGWRKTIYFNLPVLFPGLITGTIVGLGEGWEAVVGSEIIVGLKSGGLGPFFQDHTHQSHVVLVGVVALLLIIFTINKMIWLPLLEKSHKLLAE